VGDIVKLLQGARLITDAEAHLDSGLPTRTVEKRARDREERHLVSLSHTYGLASRLVALVAVIKREHDASVEPPRTRVVPVVIPEGAPFYAKDFILHDRHVCFQATLEREDSYDNFSLAQETSSLDRPLRRQQRNEKAHISMDSYASDERPEVSLIRLAARIEADGGMPGNTTEERIRKTSWALATFMFEGHKMTVGIFSPHIKRLVAFLRLQDVQHLEPEQARTLTHLLEAAEAGITPSGDLPRMKNKWEWRSMPSWMVWRLLKGFVCPNQDLS
jgi:hypothetical protein